MAGLSRRQRAAAAILEDVLRRRWAEMGAEASGLRAYYVHKLENDWLISGYDLAATLFVRRHRASFARVWEIGAGAGQLSLLLAADGIEAFAVERNPRQHGSALAVKAAMAEADPETAARFHPLHADFPRGFAAVDVGADLATVFNIGWDASGEERDAFFHRLAGFKAALADFHLLFTQSEPGGWVARKEAACERYGFAAEVAFIYDSKVYDSGVEAYLLSPGGAE